jgi:hypothetical protein
LPTSRLKQSKLHNNIENENKIGPIYFYILDYNWASVGYNWVLLNMYTFNITIFKIKLDFKTKYRVILLNPYNISWWLASESLNELKRWKLRNSPRLQQKPPWTSLIWNERLWGIRIYKSFKERLIGVWRHPTTCSPVIIHPRTVPYALISVNFKYWPVMCFCLLWYSLCVIRDDFPQYGETISMTAWCFVLENELIRQFETMVAFNYKEHLTVQVI